LDTVTYPDNRTVDFVTKYLVPLRVVTGAAPDWARRFTVQYTPTVITLDNEGNERHRTVGFLPPEEFIPSVMLGMAKIHRDRRQPVRARAMLEWLLLAYPRSRAAGEASQLLRTL
jgi:hypothetical protein